MTAVSDDNNMSENPYRSAEAAILVRKLKRLPAYLTGLIGLALGAGFYWVLCGFLALALIVHAPGTPTPREQAFIVGGAIFHGVPLILWISLRRRLYQLRVRLLWILAISCWLLIPLSAAVMLLNLGL